MERIKIGDDSWNFISETSRKYFIPFGCNYYDPETEWPPKLWQKFNHDRVNKHFDMMRDIGVNIVRIFLTVNSFINNKKGELKNSGLKKLSQMLNIAEKHNIRVILSGPSLWEGSPDWWKEQGFSDWTVNPILVEPIQKFWYYFTNYAKENNTIFSFDLQNEPFVAWNTPSMKKEWIKWLKYKNINSSDWQEIPIDIRLGAEKIYQLGKLYEFQLFREEIAYRWVKCMSDTIKSVDKNRFVSIGLHQKSVPFDWYPPDSYSGFNPRKISKFLDYISIHYYEHSFFHPELYPEPFSSRNTFKESILSGRAVIRYTYCNKPVVVEETGMWGGGSVVTCGHLLKLHTQEQQADWNKSFVKQTSGDAVGWLFWPFQDTKSSMDGSRYGGLYDFNANLKVWGKEFKKLALELNSKKLVRKKSDIKIKIDIRKTLTLPKIIKQIRQKYIEYFKNNKTVNFF